MRCNVALRRVCFCLFVPSHVCRAVPFFPCCRLQYRCILADAQVHTAWVSRDVTMSQALFTPPIQRPGPHTLLPSLQVLCVDQISPYTTASAGAHKTHAWPGTASCMEGRAGALVDSLAAVLSHNCPSSSAVESMLHLVLCVQAQKTHSVGD